MINPIILVSLLKEIREHSICLLKPILMIQWNEAIVQFCHFDPDVSYRGRILY